MSSIADLLYIIECSIFTTFAYDCQITKGIKIFRQQRLNDIEAKKAQKDAAFSEKEAKKAAKEESEAPEREALDKIRAEEERLQQIKKEEQRLENEKKALEFFTKFDSDQVGKNLLNLFFFSKLFRSHTVPV
jgi:DNA-binding transcriptional MerR regulator